MASWQAGRLMLGSFPSGDGIDVMDAGLEREEREFRKTLREFPNTFQVEDNDHNGDSSLLVSHLFQRPLQRLIHTLQSDLTAGQPTPLETARCLNLLAYLQFRQGQLRDAKEHLDKALQQRGEEHNLISLGNRAVILWREGDRSEAKLQVKKLQDLKQASIQRDTGLPKTDIDFQYLVVKANAELAFSYSRFGVRFNRKAIQLFTQVVQDAREPEIWLWKFGLALTQRRWDYMNMTTPLLPQKEQNDIITTLHIFREVIARSSCNSLKAKCYAEVGQVLNSRQRMPDEEALCEVANDILLLDAGEHAQQRDTHVRNPNMKRSTPRSTQKWNRFNSSSTQERWQSTTENKYRFKKTRENICSKALELDPDDSSVLWKVAKVYRRSDRLEEAVALLKKSVALRPTCTEYHQLGLALKALANKARKEKMGGSSNKGSREGYNGKGRDGWPRGRGHTKNMLSDFPRDNATNSRRNDSDTPSSSILRRGRGGGFRGRDKGYRNPAREMERAEPHSSDQLSPIRQNKELSARQKEIKELPDYRTPTSSTVSANDEEGEFDSSAQRDYLKKDVRPRNTKNAEAFSGQLNPSAPAFVPGGATCQSLANREYRSSLSPPRSWLNEGDSSHCSQGINMTSYQQRQCKPEFSRQRQEGNTVPKFKACDEMPDKECDSEEGAVGFSDSVAQRLEDPLSLDSGFLTGPHDLTDQFSSLSVNEETVQLNDDRFVELSQFSDISCEEGMSNNNLESLWHQDTSPSQLSLARNDHRFPGSAFRQTMHRDGQRFLPAHSPNSVYQDHDSRQNISLSGGTLNDCYVTRTAPESSPHGSFVLSRASNNATITPQSSHFNPVQQDDLNMAHSCDTVSIIHSEIKTIQGTEGANRIIHNKDVHNVLSTDVSCDELTIMKKVAKTPLRGVEFSRTDPYVTEAMEALERAVQISESTNTRAMYDLAIMHRNLREPEEAMRLLDAILRDIHRVPGPFDRVSAYEQAGLVLKEMSEAETDDEKRKNLKKESNSKLQMALLLCSRVCQKLPRFQHFIRHVWHAFPILMQDVDRPQKGCQKPDSFKEKATLLQLIRENEQSDACLEEFLRANPEEEKNPDYLWLKIKNCVDRREYRRALVLFSVLKCTAEGLNTDDSENSGYYSFQRVSMLAARESLVRATNTEDLEDARELLQQAFMEAVSRTCNQDSQSEQSDCSDDEEGEDSVDVLLLHEDTGNATARTIATFLQEACGLRVITCMQEDIPCGMPYLPVLAGTLCRSKMVVVLAGDRRVSDQLNLLLGLAAKKKNSRTVLVKRNCVPPQLMQNHRYMACPTALLPAAEVSDVTNNGMDFNPSALEHAASVVVTGSPVCAVRAADCGVSSEVSDEASARSSAAVHAQGAAREGTVRKYSDAEVQGICDIFCFLTDIQEINY